MSAFSDFEDWLLRQDYAALTIKSYLRDLEKFRTWFEQRTGETLIPTNVTLPDLRVYRQYLLTVKRHKANTVNRQLTSLRVWLHWAVSQGLIEHNPASPLRLLPQPAPAPHWISRKEQNALVRAIEKDLQAAQRYPKRSATRRRDASLVLFLLNTGLRLMEALALHLDDVVLSERKGMVLVRQGKNARQRSVPLNRTARIALKEWLDIRPHVPGNNYLFISLEVDESGPRAEMMPARLVQRAVQRFGKAAGIENLTPHMLRHTFAKNLVDAGVSLEKVAALLGHSNLNTTRIYITPSQQDLALAVEKVA